MIFYNTHFIYRYLHVMYIRYLPASLPPVLNVLHTTVQVINFKVSELSTGIEPFRAGWCPTCATVQGSLHWWRTSEWCSHLWWEGQYSTLISGSLITDHVNAATSFPHDCYVFQKVNQNDTWYSAHGRHEKIQLLSFPQHPHLTVIKSRCILHA